MLDSPGIYRAIVTSNTDATNRGRIRVQCPQISGPAELNTVEPRNRIDPIPNVGDIVWVYFSGGDTTKPVYMVSTNPYIFNTPIYATGWAANNTFHGLGGPALQYRKTSEDELFLYGNAKCTVGGNTLIFTLPPTFYNPAGPGMSGIAYKNTAGTISVVSLAVDITDGNVFVSPAPATNDEFTFAIRMPMRFLF